MKLRRKSLYAIATGDVISSSRLSAGRRRALHETMTATSRALRQAFRGAIPIEVDIFRGDSWQMLVSSPALALRAALFYRAGVRSRMGSHRVDMRIAIAIGTLDFIPGKRLSEGDGEAFQLSGKALDSMGKNASMAFRFQDRPEEKVLDVVVKLVDALAARWSDKQALAVTGALQGWKQDKIAKTCWSEPISQQAVAQHLSRAAWSSVETGLVYFEETVGRIVEREQVK